MKSCALQLLRRIGGIVFGLAATVPAALPASAAAPLPRLSFHVAGHIGVPLGSVEWTGARFVFTAEGRRTLYAADAALGDVRAFAAVPRNSGEMRCVLSPGSHGFPAGSLFCHAAQGPIYRVSADGRSVSLFATIPGPQQSDGALAFDTGGAFGYALLAATGGSDAGVGGTVYAVSSGGTTRRIGTYGGPGGAENVFIAPPTFGALRGQLLLAIDKHDHLGRLLAMDAHGAVHTVLSGLQYGLNPLAAIPRHPPARTPGDPAPGLYLADWLSHDVFFVPATALRSLAGDVLVGTERHGHLYVVRPDGRGYRAVELQTNLRAPDYNFEGAQYLVD